MVINPHNQGSKIALVCSYLRVLQAAGQVQILIFLVKIKFFSGVPIFLRCRASAYFKIFRGLTFENSNSDEKCGPKFLTFHLLFAVVKDRYPCLHQFVPTSLYNPLLHKSWGAQWLSGRVLDLRSRGCGFEPLWLHCVVFLSKTH